MTVSPTAGHRERRLVCSYNPYCCYLDVPELREHVRVGGRPDGQVPDLSRRSEFCHSADALSPSRLKRQLNVEKDAAQ